MLVETNGVAYGVSTILSIVVPVGKIGNTWLGKPISIVRRSALIVEIVTWPEIVEPLISTWEPTTRELSRALPSVNLTVKIAVVGVLVVFGIGTAAPLANVTELIAEAVDMLIAVPAAMIGTIWLGYVRAIEDEDAVAVPVTTPVIPVTLTFAFERAVGKVPVTVSVFVVVTAASTAVANVTVMGVAA